MDLWGRSVLEEPISPCPPTWTNGSMAYRGVIDEEEEDGDEENEEEGVEEKKEENLAQTTPE